MQEKTPTGGLKWVKQEILASLARVARQVQADADLGDAVTMLFEVRGILLALPLPAAALVAEEIQRTCEAVGEGPNPNRPQMREALGLALVQLPDYLERLDAGEPDNPVVLLAAINDLRHCRGAQPMSAAELLVPASVLAQAETLSPEELKALVRMAHKVRPHFHRYLVRWFNGDDAQEGLLGLARLFNHMRRYFKQGTVHELFLAAEGVVEGIVDDAITADAPTKALIGRIDRVLKPLTKTPPQWPEELASALISDLLAKMSQMPPGSPLVQELEGLYGRRLTEDDPQEPPGGDTDAAPMLEAMRHELQAACGPLFGNGTGIDRGAVGRVPRQLARLAESFGALGQEVIGQRLQRCAEALLEAVRAEQPDRTRIDDVIRALRQVDSELEALAELTSTAPPEQAHPLPRIRDLGAATLREARLELASVRATLADGAASPLQVQRVATAADAVAGVADALGGVGEPEPAGLLESLLAQLRERYVAPAQVPGDAGIELICRTLAAIDIHLEDRLERDESDGRMLAEARYAIERLAGLLPPDESTDTDSEASDSLPWSEVSQSINMEFLGLFLDEAQDELENIRAQHERWSVDIHDDVALSTLRRAFQTLKNSGSLVGARHLADLSRVTGGVLDRLLDRDLAVDAVLRDYLADVVTLLPEIIDAEAERRKPPTTELMRRGKALLEGAAAVPTPDNVIALQKPSSRPAPDGAALPGEPVDRVLSGPAAAHGAHESPGQPPPAHPGASAGAAGEPSHRRQGIDGGADPGDAAAADEDLAELIGGDLVALFADEAGELLEALDGHVQQWRRDGLNDETLASARRALHTLKGSARMAGLLPVGDLSHRLEALLSSVANGQELALPGLLEVTQRALDALASQIDAARAGTPVAIPGSVLAALERMARETIDLRPGAATADETPPAGSGPDAAASPVAPAAATGAPALRVSAERLDGMISLSAEIGAYRARVKQQNTRLGFRLAQIQEHLKRAAKRLDASATEAADDEPLRPGLDLAPAPAEESQRRITQAKSLLADAQGILTAIDDLRRETSDLLRQQRHLAEDLQDGLVRARMVPFRQVEVRLQRLVRQVAAHQHKQVELIVYGGERELDREVLERCIAPLEHLLRNAVVHGIEMPGERARQGKRARGVITISVQREGNDLVLDLADDGAGMDPARIRARAVERGLIDAEAELSADELLELTLRAGFSTADQLTQEAGRGVGLDVVAAEVAALSGEVDLVSRLGFGSNFKIRLPLTLSIVDALLVSAGGTLYAVPHGTALAVARVRREGLGQGEAAIVYQDEEFRLIPLVSALGAGAGAAPPRRPWLPVLLVASNGQRVAFQVDALIGSQRIMVKPLGPPLAALRWLSGGAVLDDGRVALIADLPALVRAGLLHGADTPEQQAPAPPPKVLVVDDSATMRQVTSRLLQRRRMQVSTARDGVDAQIKLRQKPFDLLIVDLEMPRMNGLELVHHARTTDALKQLPILMITSLGDDATRGRALAAGVDRFIAKPFSESELLAEVESLLLTPIEPEAGGADHGA